MLKTDPMPVKEPWHYHPEIELIYVHYGQGSILIGDVVDRLAGRDLYLVGANLPHATQRDKQFYEANPHQPEPLAVIVQFLPNFLGDAFWKLPEFGRIGNLLERAEYGIRFGGAERQYVGEQLVTMQQQPSHRQVLTLLDILMQLAQATDVTYLSSQTFTTTYARSHHAKLNAVYEYTYAHFTEPIELEAVAGLAGLSPTGFCRFFKARTGKTYFDYLAELRIAFACKLLAESQMKISDIVFACGFRSVSLFNRQFKEIKGRTPSDYQMDLRRRASAVIASSWPSLA